MHRIMLACATRDITQAKRFGLPVAQIAYQIARDGTLHRADIADEKNGDVLFLTADEEINAHQSKMEHLSRIIVEECKRQNFSALVFAVFKSHPIFHQLAALLSVQLKPCGIRLYLPEVYAGSSAWAQIIVPTAIWVGSLEENLKRAVAIYGKERICLDIERLRLDFSLRNQGERGEKCTAQSLYEKRRKYQPNSYFSQDLQAYYFSYENEEGTHFVLYDDTYSICEKLSLAEKLGITEAMILYPEVEDILPGIITKLSGLMRQNGRGNQIN